MAALVPIGAAIVPAAAVVFLNIQREIKKRKKRNFLWQDMQGQCTRTSQAATGRGRESKRARESESKNCIYSHGGGLYI